MTNYAKKHPYFLGTLIIGIALIILLVLGFRLQPNLSISKNGTLQATFPYASTTLYIDNEKIDTAGNADETIEKSLSVKTHTVIVSKAGYFPWTKDVTVKANETTVIAPIFITQNATGMLITKNDKDYWSIRNQVQSAKLPTEANPKIQNGVSLWITGNTVYTKENGTVKTIITPLEAIRSLDFYADRTDVIVFASDTGVYALDAIPDAAKNKANFFPIYKGTSPLFLKTDPSFLNVLDGENLMQVVI